MMISFLKMLVNKIFKVLQKKIENFIVLQNNIQNWMGEAGTFQETEEKLAIFIVMVYNKLKKHNG